jgi:hypothetical protein
MTDPVQEFLDHVAQRLDRGAQEYGNQSFLKPVASTVREILEEQVDQVGWCYVLWCQAARKLPMTRDQLALRQVFFQDLEHRIRRNDRRTAVETGNGPENCMQELEVLALDLFLQNAELQRRLLPIARAIEVAQAIQPHNPFRGRRGGTRDPRSDD